MMIDITGTKLVPGNGGKDCPGNGEHYDETGQCIECCCDECDYFLDCMESYAPDFIPDTRQPETKFGENNKNGE